VARSAFAARSSAASCAAAITARCGTVERIWDEGARSARDADLFQRMTYLELRQRLPELSARRMDRIAMASSVEGREPFLDHELVELAMALPPRMKYRDGQGKHVLREAMRDRCRPRSSRARSRASGARWRSGCEVPSATMRRRPSAVRRLAERELLDYGVADELFAAHRRGARRLEQAPVESLLRQPVVRTGG
jgi:asparagine synthase (glutamine-hydrolysing)